MSERQPPISHSALVSIIMSLTNALHVARANCADPQAEALPLCQALLLRAAEMPRQGVPEAPAQQPDARPQLFQVDVPSKGTMTKVGNFLLNKFSDCFTKEAHQMEENGNLDKRGRENAPNPLPSLTLPCQSTQAIDEATNSYPRPPPLTCFQQTPQNSALTENEQAASIFRRQTTSTTKLTTNLSLAAIGIPIPIVRAEIVHTTIREETETVPESRPQSQATDGQAEKDLLSKSRLI